MIIDLALHNLRAKEQKEPSPADTKVEDWAADFEALARKLNLREETVSGVDERAAIKNFIVSLIEKVRQEEHQSVNQIYKTREEAFQEGIKMERERILAALPDAQEFDDPFIARAAIEEVKYRITTPSHPSE
jgi:predicted metal-dependent hydrolase